MFCTNNAGIDLFAVPAQADGTGIPLAYQFVERARSDEPRVSRIAGLRRSYIRNVPMRSIHTVEQAIILDFGLVYISVIKGPDSGDYELVRIIKSISLP